MKSYVDLEGKVEAKIGDRVALIKMDGGLELIQPLILKRPTLTGPETITCEGSLHDNGSFMVSKDDKQRD